MQYAVTFFLTTIALTFSANHASASEIGSYRATLEADTKIGAGGWNNLGLALLGWSCYGSDSITFNETLPDHKGRLKSVPRNVDSKFNFSVFSMGQPQTSTFNRDMNVSDAALVMTITENCSKTTYHTEYSTDSEGNTTSEEVSDTTTAYMTWSCDTNNLPTRAGQTVHSQCTPSTSYFGDYSLEALLVNFFRQKTFKLTLSLQNIQERYTRDLCGASHDNRVVIKLNQGAGGHFGENDFVFHVTIDGKEKFDIKNDSGILNDEIAYCGGGDVVTVEVDATETDVFFDDEYKSKDAAILARNRPEVGGSAVPQKIALKRSTYFGNAFTDKDSEIEVSMREAP